MEEVSLVFNTLDRLKTKMVMMIIILLFAGLTMLVVPASYIPLLGKILGFCLLVLSILKILDFLSSKKGLIHYIGLTLGLLVGFCGILLYAIEGLFMSVLNWLTGALPILLGAVTLYHALTYVRRSGRKGWPVLIILGGLLLLFGIYIFVNPWTGDEKSVLRVIGVVLSYSSVVYIISLFLIWPFDTAARG